MIEKSYNIKNVDVNKIKNLEQILEFYQGFFQQMLAYEPHKTGLNNIKFQDE